MFANSSAVGGHTTVGDRVVLGGLVGVHQHCRVGRLAMVGGGGMCAQDVPPFTLAQGDRARLFGLNVTGLKRAGIDPSVVSEAWCHQRGYVCLIEEFGGKPVKAGESFSAAFIVGYFDSIEEMHQVYDQHKGHTGLEVTKDGWKLVK